MPFNWCLVQEMGVEPRESTDDTCLIALSLGANVQVG